MIMPIVTPIHTSGYSGPITLAGKIALSPVLIMVLLMTLYGTFYIAKELKEDNELLSILVFLLGISMCFSMGDVNEPAAN